MTKWALLPLTYVEQRNYNAHKRGVSTLTVLFGLKRRLSDLKCSPSVLKSGHSGLKRILSGLKRGLSGLKRGIKGSEMQLENGHISPNITF